MFLYYPFFILRNCSEATTSFVPDMGNLCLCSLLINHARER